MPLIQACDEDSQQANISKLIGEGYSQEQAVAIVKEMCDGKAKSIHFGTAVKALGGHRIGGYLVVFTDADHRDLQGEYFTTDTDFHMKTFRIVQSPAVYNHGLDGEITTKRIGTIVKVKQDKVGIWAEAQLEAHDEYVQKIEELVEAGILSWSSGSLSHLVEVDKDGHIRSWPIVEGSLTPTPAMPYGTEIMTLKTFRELVEGATEREGQVTPDSAIVGDDRQATSVTSKTIDNDDTHDRRKDMGTKQIDPRLVELINQLAAFVQEEMAMEAGVEMTEEEAAPVVEEIATAIEEAVEGTELAETAEGEEMDEEAVRSFIMKMVQDNLPRFMPQAIAKHVQSREQERKNLRSAVHGAMETMRHETQPSAKSRMGSYRRNPPILTGLAEKPGLATFLKCAAERDFRAFYGKAQNPYIGERGGYLLGQELSNEILPQLREEVVMFEAGVKQTSLPMGVGSITVPKMTTSPTAYRPGINTAITESDAGFDQITAFLRPIAALVTVPFQLINQSPLSVEATLREEILKSIALQVDIEILEGTGAVTGSNTGAEIKGVLTVLEGDATLSTTNIVTLGSANGRQPKYSDLNDAEIQVANGNVPDRMPKAWVMNARSRGRFRGLESTTGEPLLRDNFGNEPYQRLNGYPLFVGNQITNDKTVGSSTDTTEIYFGAWGMSEYFMQDQIEVIVDMVTKADQLQMRIIAYTYSDFIVHYPEAFYVMKGVR
ncbi:MAG: phage major capsid protein [Gammaproteobacteria bacterium]|nr:phage major capsid protein [Gammaproteobacteria bacterium]